MLDGGGEKPSWEMISSKEEKGEMRTKDPWSSLSRPSSVIYIQRSAVIPSTWKYLASHHARFASIQTIIVLSLLLLRIFNTKPTPSFIEIVRGNVTQKLGLFLSFFPSICLPSLHFYPRRRWRTMVAQSIARGKFKFSFLYPTFDSVGKRVTQALEHTLLPPPPSPDRKIISIVSRLYQRMWNPPRAFRRPVDEREGKKIGRLETEASLASIYFGSRWNDFDRETDWNFGQLIILEGKLEGEGGRGGGLTTELWQESMKSINNVGEIIDGNKVCKLISDRRYFLFLLEKKKGKKKERTYYVV